MKKRASPPDPFRTMGQELDLTVGGEFGLTSGIVRWMGRRTVLFWCDVELPRGSRNDVQVGLGSGGSAVDCLVEVTKCYPRQRRGTSSGHMHLAFYWPKEPKDGERLHRVLARINPDAFDEREAGQSAAVQGQLGAGAGESRQPSGSRRTIRKTTSRAQMLVSAARLKKRADATVGPPRPAANQVPRVATPEPSRRAPRLGSGQPTGAGRTTDAGWPKPAERATQTPAPAGKRQTLRYGGSSLLMRERARESLRARGTRPFDEAEKTPVVERPRVVIKPRPGVKDQVRLLAGTIKQGDPPSLLLRCDDAAVLRQGIRLDGQRALLRLAPLHCCAEGTEVDVFMQLPDNTFVQFSATVTATTSGRTIVNAPFLDEEVAAALELAMNL